MKGKYKFTLSVDRLRYELEIKRNITIIQGKSASGKTTLMKYLWQHKKYGGSSGVDLECDVSCIPMDESFDDCMVSISRHPGSIIFMDEDVDYLDTKEFANLIKNSDNYFVLITREDLKCLPYSVDEIYELSESKSYIHLKTKYDKAVIAPRVNINNISKHIVLTEDQGSGLMFYENLFRGKALSVRTTNGNSSMYANTKNIQDFLAIVDGAAFGAYVSEMVELLKYRPNSGLLYPESFEWLMLKAVMFNYEGIKSILDTPYNYIESQDYFSWENYFVKILIQVMQDRGLVYNKSSLPQLFDSNSVYNNVIELLGLRDSDKHALNVLDSILENS